MIICRDWHTQTQTRTDIDTQTRRNADTRTPCHHLAPLNSTVRILYVFCVQTHTHSHTHAHTLTYFGVLEHLLNRTVGSPECIVHTHAHTHTHTHWHPWAPSQRHRSGPVCISYTHTHTHTHTQTHTHLGILERLLNGTLGVLYVF